MTTKLGKKVCNDRWADRDASSSRFILVETTSPGKPEVKSIRFKVRTLPLEKPDVALIERSKSKRPRPEGPGGSRCGSRSRATSGRRCPMEPT